MQGSSFAVFRTLSYVDCSDYAASTCSNNYFSDQLRVGYELGLQWSNSLAKCAGTRSREHEPLDDGRRSFFSSTIPAMFEHLGKFELNLASLCSVFIGALGCWIVQRIVQRPQKARPQVARVEQPQNSDAATVLKLRAAEDELVLRWLSEKPGREKSSSPPQDCPASRELAPPELALTHIAAELLPFNPQAACLTGKTLESDMTATVERIEKLLASVEPPSSLATMLLGTFDHKKEAVPSIRDPQARYKLQPEDPQRRHSDQAIIYDTLLRRCLGDDDFAWRMLHKFPSRCRAELESLATELNRRAWTPATRRISQLRGMAANVAADNLRDALANLELVCRQQSATRAEQLLEAVHGEFQQILEFLDRAGGEQFLDSCDRDENQPVSRWPADYIAVDNPNPFTLETPLTARVLRDAQHT